MLVVAALSLVTGILGGHFGAVASAGLAKNLRQSMFEKIQSYSFSNIDRFSTSSLVTRLTTDVTNIQMAYQMILRMCFRSPFSLICAMVMAFTISPKLASVYLVAVFFLGFVFSLIIIFVLTVTVSRLSARIRRLAQIVAMLNSYMGEPIEDDLKEKIEKEVKGIVSDKRK